MIDQLGLTFAERGGGPITLPNKEVIEEALDFISEAMAVVDGSASRNCVESMKKILSEGKEAPAVPGFHRPAFELPGFGVVQFASEASVLRGRVLSELREQYSFLLSAQEASLYMQMEPLFGREVECALPNAAEDIAEAGRCLALDRNTAAIFHLMRALELAVRAVATKLNATVQDSSGKYLPWGVMNQNAKVKIDAMPAGSDKTAWERVHALFESLGRAWRNETMHPKHNYSHEEAQEVFSIAKSFMRHLAPLL